MATIQRRETADGTVRWTTRVFIARDPVTGKRKFSIRTFGTEKAAKAHARKLEGMKDDGALSAPTRDPVRVYVRRWLNDVMKGRIRARTWSDYDSILRRYVERAPDGAPPIGHVRMDRLTVEGVQSFYGWLREEKKLAPATIRRLHAVLRQAFAYAVRTGALGRNPADLVTLPRQTKREVRAMSQEEATRFLEAARADRLAALWHVLLLGGLRPSEALALAWADVDLESGKVRVQRTLVRRGVRKRGVTEGPTWALLEPKTARARRTVPLPAFVGKMLREHKARQAEERLKLGAEYESHGFVFATEFGKPLDLANVADRNFRRVCSKAELGTWGPEPKPGARGPKGHRRFHPAFRLYDLRHSCATLLLRAGVNPKVTSERLGHASVAFTLDVYSASLPDMQEDAAEKLGAMLGAGRA